MEAMVLCLWLKPVHTLAITGSRWSYNPQGPPPVAYSSQPGLLEVLQPLQIAGPSGHQCTNT